MTIHVLDVSPTEFPSPLGNMSTVSKNNKRFLVDTGSAALIFWDEHTQIGNVTCDSSHEQEISYVGDTVCVESHVNPDFNIKGAYVTKMSSQHKRLLQPVSGILGLLPPKHDNPDCSLPAINTHGVAKDLNCHDNHAFYNVNLDLDTNGRGTLEYKCTIDPLKGSSMLDTRHKPYLNTCVHHAIIPNAEGDTLYDTGWPTTTDTLCINTYTERHKKCKTKHDCTDGVTPRVCTHDAFVGHNTTLQFSDTGGTVNRSTADFPSRPPAERDFFPFSK